MAQFTDRMLKCVECHNDFIFDVGEQTYFAENGLKNVPKRCKPCRAKAKVKREEAKGVTTEVTCSDCGALTTVPFIPTPGRLVYCFDCLEAHRR